HEMLRFVVDADKAQRNGISVDDINRALEMAMGGHVLGDIKRNSTIDPTHIILQVPLSARSQLMRLVQLPVTNMRGHSVSLSELGSFRREPVDLPIFHKDLNPVEFVTAEGVGRYAAPVYGQFEVESLLQNANDGQGYQAPDGSILTAGHWLGAPDNVGLNTDFEWGGEWTVTYETFRDMGIAFAAALVLIYMLIVAQFGNFTLPAIIMAPIPLTLIGIVPGHWIMGAEFTATSMIGFIALAGIIVRNSILLVDFVRESVRYEGLSVTEAVILSCEARTRPILITALALLGGSMVILSDPIFQGMAVSLIFGGAVSTLLTLIVIPLGCISARNVFGEEPSPPDDPPGGGSGSPDAPGGGSRTAVQKKKLSSGAILEYARAAAAYSGLYLVSLGQAFWGGVQGWLAVIGRIRRKRPPAGSGGSRVAVTTAKALSGPAAVAEKIHKADKIKEKQPETRVEIADKVEESVRSGAESPKVGQQENKALVETPEPPDDISTESDTMASAGERPEPAKPRKPAKRRGIKLKKDI
nr:efflux RND transporter permease subunit [Thiolinea sp.]